MTELAGHSHQLLYPRELFLLLHNLQRLPPSRELIQSEIKTFIGMYVCFKISSISADKYFLTLRMLYLIFTMMWTNLTDDKLTTFFLIFSWNIGSDTSYKLSPEETICIKHQTPFSGKSMKNISKCGLRKYLPRMQSLKYQQVFRRGPSKCPQHVCSLHAEIRKLSTLFN